MSNLFSFSDDDTQTPMNYRITHGMMSNISMIMTSILSRHDQPLRRHIAFITAYASSYLWIQNLICT